MFPIFVQDKVVLFKAHVDDSPSDQQPVACSKGKVAISVGKQDNQVKIMIRFDASCARNTVHVKVHTPLKKEAIHKFLNVHDRTSSEHTILLRNYSPVLLVELKFSRDSSPDLSVDSDDSSLSADEDYE